MKKRTLRSNQETDEGKRCAALANSLTKKAPYKGLGAESEEKREPVSDIDTAVVDSLKALDPDGRLEKRTNGQTSRYVRFVPKPDSCTAAKEPLFDHLVSDGEHARTLAIIRRRREGTNWPRSLSIRR